jgi:hypothetical protein
VFCCCRLFARDHERGGKNTLIRYGHEFGLEVYVICSILSSAGTKKVGGEKEGPEASDSQEIKY